MVAMGTSVSECLQQRELEMLHQKGKSIVNDADSDDYSQLE